MEKLLDNEIKDIKNIIEDHIQIFLNYSEKQICCVIDQYGICKNKIFKGILCYEHSIINDEISKDKNKLLIKKYGSGIVPSYKNYNNKK
jgi:hypothetical protein